MRFHALMKSRPVLEAGDVSLYFGLLIFRLVLDASYQYFLSPVFGSDSPVNFLYAVDIDRYLLSLIVFGLFVTVVRSQSEDMTNVFMLMAAIFVMAPLTSEYGLNAARPAAPVFCAAIALLVVDLVSRVPLPAAIFSRTIPHGRALAVGLSAASVIYLLVWGYLSGAAAYLNFDVRRIYEFRDQVAMLLDVGPLAYLNLWTYKVFTIFLVCMLLQTKRFGWCLVVLACQLYFFGLTSHRIILFLPLLAIGFWLYLGRSNELSPLPYLLSAGILLALGLFLIWGVESLPEMVIRRAFFVPSGLIFQWFDFFDTHAHVYWADKLLASFASGEYVRINVPRLVGDFLVPGSNSAANAGMVASGYAHAGYWGVMFYALVLGIVLGVLNAVVRSGVPLWLVAALSIGPLRTAIADSDLFTSLLSHGLGVTVLVLWLYKGGGAVPGARKGASSTA